MPPPNASTSSFDPVLLPKCYKGVARGESYSDTIQRTNSLPAPPLFHSTTSQPHPTRSWHIIFLFVFSEQKSNYNKRCKMADDGVCLFVCPAGWGGGEYSDFLTVGFEVLFGHPLLFSYIRARLFGIVATREDTHWAVGDSNNKQDSITMDQGGLSVLAAAEMEWTMNWSQLY